MGDLFDTLAAEKRERRNNVDLSTIAIAKKHWDNMDNFRKDGWRCHEFASGKQWNDPVFVDGKWKTEYAALIEQGFNPRTTNLLNRVVKNVMGVILKNGNEPTAYSHDGSEQGACDVFNVLLQANNTRNKTKLLWPQQFKQFLEWGAIISKIEYGYINNKLDSWTENIDPRSFFCDTGTMDIRGLDCDMVGMLHTLPLDEVLSSFATGKPKEAHEKHKRICEIYKKCGDRKYVSGLYSEQFGDSKLRNVDFIFPKDHDKCRVIEIWTKERREVFYVHDTMDGTITIVKADEYESFVEEENAKRIAAARNAGVSAIDIANAQKIVDDPVKAAEDDIVMPQSCRLRIPEFREDRYWYYRFVSPSGDVLDEGESPYIHKGHPFVFVFYPFVNGEIQSYIYPLIEEQKNLNRNRTMYDMIMRLSMKGFTAYDRNTLPDDDPNGDRLMEQVAQPGGTYGFNLKPGEQIQNKVVQMSSNNTGVGLMEMIQMDTTNIEDISGVNGALQGKPGYSSTSGSLYMQQAQNATGSLLDVIECYYAFLMDCAYKQCSNMLQYYDERTVKKIAGEEAWNTLQMYLASNASDSIELDFKMLESPSSPVYRQIANDFLQSWLQMGLIDFPTMLKIGNFAFSDKLQVALDQRNQQLALEGQQGLPTAVPQQGNEQQAAVAGVRAAMAGSGQNMYNTMAEKKQV